MNARNIPGNVPDPDELYGRRELLAHIWRQIGGNNILLLAPRRFGKTGVMMHMVKNPASGYLPIYFELEDVSTPQEFVWRLARELLSRQPLRHLVAAAGSLPRVIQDWAKQTFDEVGFDEAKVKFKNVIADDWRVHARRLLVEMEKADHTVIFILDELPAMLEKMSHDSGDETARDFMAWFRGARIQHQQHLRRHRFVVGGSVGIDLILRRLNCVDKFNDFERVYVQPLADEDAAQLIKDLSGTPRIELLPDAQTRLLALIGSNVPYFIHLFFSQIAQLPPSKRQPLSVDSLEDLYRRQILGPTCKSYFDHYRARLARYGQALERAAIDMLRAVAYSPSGRASSSVLYDAYRRALRARATELQFRELLADLECDWYLVLDPATNEYRFILNVMRDFWHRWYGAPPLAGARRRGRVK